MNEPVKLNVKQRLATPTQFTNHEARAYLESEHARADDLATQLATAQVEAALWRNAYADLQSYGCPLCHGDCAAANPPVMSCPMQYAAIAVDDRKDTE